jgi:hypothetical protein
VIPSGVVQLAGGALVVALALLFLPCVIASLLLRGLS